jgi:hypothetical protein
MKVSVWTFLFMKGTVAVSVWRGILSWPYRGIDALMANS